MKKIIFIAMIITCLVALVGCGKTVTEKLNASITEELENGKKIETTLELVFTDNVLSRAKEEKRFPNKDMATQYKELIEAFDGNNSNAKISISGNRVTEEFLKINSSYKYYGMSQSSITTILQNDGWKIE